MVYVLSSHEPFLTSNLWNGFFCYSVNLPEFSGTFTLRPLLILFVLEVYVAGETKCESECGYKRVESLFTQSNTAQTYCMAAFYSGLFRRHR